MKTIVEMSVSHAGVNISRPELCHKRVIIKKLGVDGINLQNANRFLVGFFFPSSHASLHEIYTLIIKAMLLYYSMNTKVLQNGTNFNNYRGLIKTC